MELFSFNEERINQIDQFMKKLIEAKTSKEKVLIYRSYVSYIEEITPMDIFYLGHYRQDSTLSIDQIKQNANRFINVFHKGLDKYSKKCKHLLCKELIAENDRIEEHLNQLKQYFKSKDFSRHREEIFEGFKNCLEYEKKFIKFENIIFPRLEKKLPSTRPFEVLWSLNDDARYQLKQLIVMFEQKALDMADIIPKIGSYYELMFGINQKHQLIIIPLLELLIKEEDLSEMLNECLTYGFVFKEIEVNDLQKPFNETNQGLFQTITGTLSHQILNLVLSHIPIDITVVDENDFVIYYNNRLERHFPRNPSIIGRLVKHCHPPKSVHLVEQIIEDFKAGDKDHAEFWIQFNHSFLYITYVALRDNDRNYLGILEVSQDVTKIRNLEGEKRLL